MIYVLNHPSLKNISTVLEIHYWKHNYSKLDTTSLNLLFQSHPIIIIDPFLINQIYFTISPFWKRYLARQAPETRLIVMGFVEYRSRNYIDLLNLPEDFEAFLENAQPVNAEWEIPIDGANMLEYMQRFFEGHGGQSLLSKLNAVMMTFNIACTNLSDGVSSFEEVWHELLRPYGLPEWRELLARWKNYWPYFEYLPFFPTMQEIDAIFSDISAVLSCERLDKSLFLQHSFDEKLSEVHQKLTEIDRLYIRP